MVRTDGIKGGHLTEDNVLSQPEKYRFVYDVEPLLEKAEALLEELEAGYEWCINTGEIPKELSGDDYVEVRYMSSNHSNSTYPYHTYYWEIEKGDGFAIKEYRKVRT